MSRNIATVKVAEQTGYDQVVALWKKAKVGETDQVKAYPSIALGVVELTPLEVAEAYTVFPNRGTHQEAALASSRHQRRARRQAEGRAGPRSRGRRPRSWSPT